MTIRIWAGLLATVASLAMASQGAWAQAWPAKPIRLVVTFAAGGGTDFVARAIAPRLSQALGQPVVVENRAGANGVIGVEAVAKSPPDGYTVVMGAAGTLAVTPHLSANLPFDTFRDLAPVSLVATSPFVVSLHPSVPAGSLVELIALAKSGQGRLNYGSSGTGGAPHLATELFMRMTGASMVHVPYKGLGPAITDLLGGQIQLLFADVGLVLPHLKAGKIRGLAVSGATRSAVVPELPTVAEAGVPGYQAGTWYGILAPAGTAGAIVARLSAEINRALALAEVRASFVTQGLEAAGDTPEQFAAYIREEHAKWGKLIREAGIRLD